MFRKKIDKLQSLYKDRENQKSYLGWMIEKTRPYVKQLLLLFSINIVLSLVGVSIALLNKKMIDSASGKYPRLSVGLFVVLIIFTIGSNVAGAISGILTTYINERYTFSVRNQVFSNVVRSKWLILSSYHSGDMMTRLTSDIENVAGGIATMIPGLLYMIVQLVVSFVVLFYYDHFIAVSALILGPTGVLFGLMFGEKLKLYQKKLQENESKFRSFMQESVYNISVIKVFEKEDVFCTKMADLRQDRLSVLLKKNYMGAMINLAMGTVYSTGYLLAFGWGMYRLSRGEITYGVVSLFLALVSQVQGPIRGLANYVSKFIGILASAGRVMEIDALEQEIYIPKEQLGVYVGIRIENLSFSYDTTSVLSHINLDIKPASVIGIIGDSGSGKTTLARLILGLIISDEGSIYFYDKEEKKERVSPSARRLISYVPQGSTLMDGTIRSNLELGDDKASDEQMWQALKTADIYDFVKSLPSGLDTRLHEHASISGGQAQRIAIARALIRNTPILILDEATSDLDLNTEETIVRNLKLRADGTTCIVITHRPSLLSICSETYKVADNNIEKISED